MWRSVAARASTARQVARKNRAINTSKVSSSNSQSLTPFPHFSNESYIYQNPRTFSPFYYSTANPSSENTTPIWDLGEETNFEFENGDTHDVGMNNMGEVSNNYVVEEVEETNEGEETNFPEEFSYAHDVGIDNTEELRKSNVFVQEESYEVDFEKLQNVLSVLQSSVDGSLESILDGLDLDLHEEFLVKVLETPYIPGENMLGYFDWASKKEGFLVTTRMLKALVQTISGQLRKNDAYALWDLVKEIGEKEIGVVNVEVLNGLIALFSKLGKGKAGIEVFDKLEEFGCVPNEDSYFFTIEALCRRSFYDWAVSVSEKMIGVGILPDNEKLGNMISWFCKGSKAGHAHLIYSLGKEKNRNPPQSSMNFLISSLCREDENVKLALEMLDDLTDETRKSSIKVFTTVLRSLCRIKDVDGAKKLLHKMIDSGPPPGNNVFNLVINALSKAGDMEDAKEIMKLMVSRGLRPDVYTYSVIMSGYVKGGQMEDACIVLSDAQATHAKLSPVAYHTLIRGYCKLEEFDKALELLAKMKDYGVIPNTDEYNKLIQSLCLKAQDWQTAEKLLEEMNGKGLYLNGMTKGLIQAVKDLEEETNSTSEVFAEA